MDGTNPDLSSISICFCHSLKELILHRLLALEALDLKGPSIKHGEGSVDSFTPDDVDTDSEQHWH